MVMVVIVVDCGYRNGSNSGGDFNGSYRCGCSNDNNSGGDVMAVIFMKVALLVIVLEMVIVVIVVEL